MIIYQPFNHINSKTKVTIYVSEKKDGNFKTYQSIKQYFNNYIPDLAQKRLKYFAHEHQAHRQFSTQKQDYYIADAMITSSDQIVLGMNVADCFPIVYFDPIKFKIALIHGGWKPLFQNILELTWYDFTKLQQDSTNLLAWIGPGIRKCHYFFDQQPLQCTLNSWKNTIYKNKTKWQINLPKFIKNELQRIGFIPKKILDSQLCTYCQSNLYSHMQSKEQDSQDGRFFVLATIDKI